jgi:hypothetical protein
MFEITSPNTGEKLQVALHDFEEKMIWEQAISACEELGNGWRLPTIKELEVMYKELHKKGNGNFKEPFYWSSTENDDDNAWYFFFVYDNSSIISKYSTLYVRAVRAL